MSVIYKKEMYIWLAAALLVAGSLGGCGKRADLPVGTGTAAVEEMSPVEPGTQLVQRIGQLTLDGPDYEVVKDIIIPETELAPEYLRGGVEHARVAELQARLMELGFMDNNKPAQYFGHTTQAVVLPSRRQNELNTDGIVGPGTQDAITAPDAKYYAVSGGVSGKDVKRAQNRLYELGHLAIPDLVTGKFSDATEAAVIKLQEVNGIAVDGKVGRQTINLLYSDEIKPNMLAYGDKSEVVLAAQKRLKDLGYLTTDPDGSYGFDTTAAVKQFQSCNDLVVDGYLGPSTRFMLDDSSIVPNGMSLGDQGDSVQRVQQLLSKYGYLSSSNVAGYYGEVTEGVTKNSQPINGFSSDGFAGRLTMAKLIGDNVKKVTSKSGTSSSGGNGKKFSSGNSGGSSGGGGGGVSSLTSVASPKLGGPYVYGAKGPSFFDCFDFAYWCLNQVGIKQNYLTSSGWCSVRKYAKISNFGDLRVGDIIVANGHVGIVTNGGTVIDASSSNEKVVHRSLSSWRRSSFICGWRIFGQRILK